MHSNPLLRKYSGVLFLLCLFAGYLSCIFGYSHVHVIDGVRIVHSHPYQTGHEKDSHTQTELLLVANISYFIADVPFSDGFDFTPFLKVEEVLQASVVRLYTYQTFRFISLRAPPVV